MVAALRLASTAEQSCWQKEDGANKRKHGVKRDANQAKRQRYEPNHWPKD
jgi:hypothetical protein